MVLDESRSLERSDELAGLQRRQSAHAAETAT